MTVIIRDLTDDNFIFFAIQHYEYVHAGMDHFNQDLRLTIYIHRLLKRYKRTGEMKERLLLNHIITLLNAFSDDAAVRILFYKTPSDFHKYLKTFLIFLGRIEDDGEIDQSIMDKLKEL